jgi:hypothetical protein
MKRIKVEIKSRQERFCRYRRINKLRIVNNKIKILKIIPIVIGYHREDDESTSMATGTRSTRDI